MDIISVHYKDIRKLFTNRCMLRKMNFSDDTFNESFIKCAQHFNNATILYDDAVRYFWVVYLNTVKSNASKNSKVVLCEAFDDDIMTDDDNDDDKFAKYFYDTIMNAITEAFSENDMMIYSLYKYNGWTKNDLITAGYDCKNFEIKIKNIHRFVKNYTKLKYKK